MKDMFYYYLGKYDFSPFMKNWISFLSSSCVTQSTGGKKKKKALKTANNFINLNWKSIMLSSEIGKNSRGLKKRFIHTREGI